MTGETLQTGAQYATLEPGDPAPHFAQTAVSGTFNLSNLGGGCTAMALFMSSSAGAGRAILEIVGRYAGILDGKTRFLAVTVDREDAGRLKEARGMEVILDFDGKVSRQYGAVPATPPTGAAQIQFHTRFIILDRRLRVLANLVLKPDGSDADRIIPEIESLPRIEAADPVLPPPVLIVPRVFLPEFCRQLIARFESGDHQDTGVVRQTGDRTSVVIAPDFKRRRDLGIEDAQTIAALKEMLRRRLLPEMAKAFQFNVSHVERHIIARYSATEQGHFKAHRDNNNRGTAYRRFAATINLNDDFDGGELSFPEFGPQSFKAPAGGAIVFSCSLLHEVGVMTRGQRYAYLPFFYDEAAAHIREEGRAAWTHELANLTEDMTRF